MKFKVGDKVRILDGSGIEDYAMGWAEGMKRCVGEVGNVMNAADNPPRYRITGFPYSWDERGLELVEEAEAKDEAEIVEKRITITNEFFCEKVAKTIAHGKAAELVEKNPLMGLLLTAFGAELAVALFESEEQEG